ncbi:MAG: hypothetical protein AUK56_08510 [Thiomicrospira sp. CG2_30_44_34]|nr:MAG: hypothetical protein AUK56_08510 [Thiomicrospira sp. CG2_30_44_34]
MEIKEQLPGALEILAKTGIPQIPKAVLELQRLLEQDETIPNFITITNIVSEDIELAGEVVHAANLPAIQGNHPREIVSIESAVEVLGIRRLKNLVKAIALKLSLEGIRPKSIPRHSLSTAEVCAQIAQNNTFFNTDEAYLIGLFHNLGAVMLAKFDNHYESIFNKSLSAPSQALQQEYNQYKTSHPIIGLLVAEKWQLSDLVKKIILLHHQSNLKSIRSEQLKQGIAMIQLANTIIAERLFNVYITPELHRISEECVTILDLTPEMISKIWHSLD